MIRLMFDVDLVQNQYLLDTLLHFQFWMKITILGKYVCSCALYCTNYSLNVTQLFVLWIWTMYCLMNSINVRELHYLCYNLFECQYLVESLMCCRLLEKLQQNFKPIQLPVIIKKLLTKLISIKGRSTASKSPNSRQNSFLAGKSVCQGKKITVGKT